MFKMPVSGPFKHGDFYVFVSQLQAVEDAEKESWLSTELSKHVPASVMRAGKVARLQPMIARWLERNGFTLQVHPKHTCLLRHDKALARFEKGWSTVINRWSDEPRNGPAIQFDHTSPASLRELYGVP